MKRRRLLHFLAAMAGLFQLATSANDIEPGKDKYEATRINKAVVIDGDLSEWAGVPVLADPKFAIPKGSGASGNYVLFEEYNGGTWTGPSDHTSAVQVVWDDDNLYIGIVVTDEYHENSANSAWNGDSAQLMIANGTRSTQVALYNYAQGGIETELGETIIMHEAGPPLADPECNCDTVAVVKRDTATKKTTYEIKMPAKAVGLTKIVVGDKVGLGMAINDGDEATPGQRGWGGLGAHSIVFGKTPSETAELTMSSKTPTVDQLFLSAVNTQPEIITFRINDKGTSIYAPGTVKLSLNGQTVSVSETAKVAGAVDVTYTPPTLFPSGVKQSYVIELKDTSGATITTPGEFTPVYVTIPASLKVTTVDTSKPGFIFNVFQNEANTTTTSARAEASIAGELMAADGTPLPNLADPSIPGPATGNGTPAAPGSKPIKFEIPTVINMSQEGVDNAGNWTDSLPADNPLPDDVMPGIPGTNGSTDGIAAEILSWVELPKGWVTLGVNSDDGFLTAAGGAPDVFLGIRLGVFEGGRGAADTTFKFYVEEAGFYRLRTIWYEGGGGANIEWFSVDSTGKRTLLNDTANGGYRAFRAVTGAAPAAVAVVTSVAPAPNETGANPNKITATIRDGANAVATSSVSLKVDGVAVNATVTKSGSTTTVDYVPNPIFSALSKHTATLTYTDGGQTITRDWSFTVGVFTKDTIKSYVGVIKGTAAHTADAGGRTGQAGDYAIDLGRGGGNQTVLVGDATFLNATTGDNEMSFSVWQKLHAVANSSVFWARSTGSRGTNRGWQAHTPWSDSTIYFDTAGCCDGGLERVSKNISEFEDYTGDAAWWQSWHHFVFTKKGDVKQIWIDGKLFLDGTDTPNTNPIPTDFTDLYIGAEPPATGNNLQGVLDDFAIFDKALNETQVKALFAGTAPGAVTGNPGLIAYWPFNDPPAPPSEGPDYAIGLNFGADEASGSNSGTLAASAAAGAPGLVQANWNNLTLLNGTNTTLVADVGGAAQPSGATVTWTSANTWSATGRGEENLGLTGNDKTLMTGYLDTGAPSTTTVTVSGIPAALTSNGYDVIVYATGGVGGRGGGYRILDGVSGAVLKDYVKAQSPTNATSYIQVVPNPAAHAAGNYIVFSGIGASSIKIEATTANGLGFGSPNRAPINAVQLVSPASATPPPSLSVARTATGVTITFTGKLQSADNPAGPYTDVAGATSPTVVSPTGAAKFYRSAK